MMRWGRSYRIIRLLVVVVGFQPEGRCLVHDVHMMYVIVGSHKVAGYPFCFGFQQLVNHPRPLVSSSQEPFRVEMPPQLTKSEPSCSQLKLVRSC